MSGGSDSIASSTSDRDKVGILVEEAYAQSPERFTLGPLSDRTYKRQICKAVRSGDWVKASSYDKDHPNWVCTSLTTDGNTALHIAVNMEQTNFVAMLVERTSIQDMEIRNAYGNTAFSIAATLGNVEIASTLIDKNPGLIWIKDKKEMLPIHLASLAGHQHMVNFLFERTPNLPFHDIVKLFFLTLTNGIYNVALSLLNECPQLAGKECEEIISKAKGLTALQVLAQSPFDKHAPGYGALLNSLFTAMEEEEFLQSEKTSEAMYDAAKSGNKMVLEFIFDYAPNLWTKVNSEGQSILHLAILYRQRTVCSLILSKGAYKTAMLHVVDNHGNNVLHLVGKLGAEARFAAPIHHVLIRSEEQWFKDVEKVVPAAFRTMKNNDGLTPNELFYVEHKDHSEKALSAMNEMANNFLVVGTLIVTLGITAALTIRTNNVTGPTPMFKENTWYIIFTLSVAFGVSLCVLSMIFFTSVLATWKLSTHGFISSRLARMWTGCLLLYASVGVLGVFALISGVVLVFTFFPRWVFIVIAALIGIPFILSFLIYKNSFFMSVRLMLVLSGEVGNIMGIKWTPFTFGYDVM